jgi:hypothetical protein
VPEDLQGAAVTGGAAVGDDDAIRRLLRRTDTGEANAGCHRVSCSSIPGPQRGPVLLPANLGPPELLLVLLAT